MFSGGMTRTEPLGEDHMRQVGEVTFAEVLEEVSTLPLSPRQPPIASVNWLPMVVCSTVSLRRRTTGVPKADLRLFGRVA